MDKRYFRLIDKSNDMGEIIDWDQIESNKVIESYEKYLIMQKISEKMLILTR